MNRALESIEQSLQQKTELTVRAVDTLMEEAMQQVTIMGMPVGKLLGPISLRQILPKKSEENTRRFLYYVTAILQAVLDGQVSFNEFVPFLAEYIKDIQAIYEEEKQA